MGTHPPATGTERAARRRAELISAAADYVFANGLASLSLRPLAEALETSHRTLLYHFGSKEALIAEVLREARHREQRVVAEHARAEATFSDALRAVWDRYSAPEHLAFLRLYHEFSGIALHAGPALVDPLAESVREWMTTVSELARRHGATAEDAEAIGTFVAGSVRGLQLDLLATGERTRVERGLSELIHAIEHRLTE